MSLDLTSFAGRINDGEYIIIYSFGESLTCTGESGESSERIGNIIGI
jgi:hypothetical protein